MSELYDWDAESAVIGCCLLRKEAVEWSIQNLTAADFSNPTFSTAFAAIGELYHSGRDIDILTVTERVKALGGKEDGVGTQLASALSDAPSASSIRTYGEIVSSYSLRRSMNSLGLSLAERAKLSTEDPALLLELMTSELQALDSPIIVRDPGDLDIDDFLSLDMSQAAPWVIEGIIRQGWRIMIVAPEGVGKSVVMRQLAVCAGYGIHPFTHHTIPAINVLIVDLENPDEVIFETLNRLVALCEAQRGMDRPDTVRRLLRRPQGLDLRSRSGRAELEDVIKRNRPDLVVLGPVYKAYRRKRGESFEEIAAGVTEVLDNLRTRYDFALVLEHHAPKGNRDGRLLEPEGSGIWMRWTELGLKLVPPPNQYPPSYVDVSSYRYDRVEHSWPTRLIRGTKWHWEESGARRLHQAA